MSKHTPGPWHANGPYSAEDGGPEIWSVLGADPAYEATICELWSGEHDNKTNAHLIAAAPDLLEALELLWKVNCGPYDGDDPEWQKARAAIAKAKGESE